MRKTWFYGLALTLGVTAIPSVASAQYSVGNTGAGLSASSFNANAGAVTSGTAMRSYMAPQSGQANFASYPQNSAIGSGVTDGHVHVPLPSATDNAVLNTQYSAAPSYPGPAITPSVQSNVQPTYSVPSPYASSPIVGSACPACESGNCATHGTGLPSGQIVSTVPSYGAVGSCYAQPAMNYGPSISSPSPWIFGASGLLFNRVDNEQVRLATNSYNNPNLNPTLSTDDARMRASGGMQTSVGRYFGCGRYAMVGSYWGIYSNPQSVTVLQGAVPPNDLRSNLPFTTRGAFVGNIPVGIRMPGAPIYDPINDPLNTTNLNNVYSIYDNAYAHRLVRDNDIQNVELNFFSFALGGGARQPYAMGCGTGGGCGTGSVGGYGSCGSNAGCGSGPTGPCAPWYGAQCSKLRLNLFGGVRWFRFKDSLEYAASATDSVFGTTDDDFYYRNNVTNDLVGFQLGSMATYCTGTRFNLYSGTSFGVFGNHIAATTRAGTTNTTAEIIALPGSPFNGRLYDYSTTRNDVALLGEGNVGTGIRISQGWTANLGYRVVGVSGIATAVGQIPRDFSNGADASRIHNDRSLILHGLVLGAMYNF